METGNKMIPKESEDISAGIETLCNNSIELIQYARQMAVKQINLVQIITYYAIGRWIVEEQQNGTSRARYGAQVIRRLSDAKTERVDCRGDRR